MPRPESTIAKTRCKKKSIAPPRREQQLGRLFVCGRFVALRADGRAREKDDGRAVSREVEQRRVDGRSCADGRVEGRSRGRR